MHTITMISDKLKPQPSRRQPMPLNPPPSFDLSGKVALVTGGSRGLGREMVAGFAHLGADVVIASRDAASCADYAREITATTGRRALGVGAHVGHWSELDSLVDTAYAEFGQVDVLVNNAGMSPLYDSVDAVSEELFDKVIAVNLKGPFRLAVLVGVRMAASRGSPVARGREGTFSASPQPRRAAWARAWRRPSGSRSCARASAIARGRRRRR